MAQDEFVQAVWEEVLNGTDITDSVLLDIVVPLYRRMIRRRSVGEVSNRELRYARRGIDQIKYGMYNNVKAFDLKTDCRLNFLYSKVSVVRKNLAYWCSVPEFVHEVLKMDKNGTVINDKTILPLMERVFADKKALQKVSEQKIDFDFARAHKAITQLKKYTPTIMPEDFDSKSNSDSETH